MANYYSQATITPCLPATLFREEELDSLSRACGLTTESEGDDLYFFAEECFSDEGEDENGETFDCLALLQGKLRQLDASTYPHIVIEGATVCGRMRPGGFGGFAYYITRDEIRSIATSQWLLDQPKRAGHS